MFSLAQSMRAMDGKMLESFLWGLREQGLSLFRQYCCTLESLSLVLLCYKYVVCYHSESPLGSLFYHSKMEVAGITSPFNFILERQFCLMYTTTIIFCSTNYPLIQLYYFSDFKDSDGFDEVSISVERLFVNLKKDNLHFVSSLYKKKHVCQA